MTEVYEADADSKKMDEYNWNTIPHFKKLTHKSAYLISKHDASCMLRTCIFKFDTFLCCSLFVVQRRENTTFKNRLENISSFANLNSTFPVHFSFCSRSVWFLFNSYYTCQIRKEFKTKNALWWWQEQLDFWHGVLEAITVVFAEVPLVSSL